MMKAMEVIAKALMKAPTTMKVQNSSTINTYKQIYIQGIHSYTWKITHNQIRIGTSLKTHDYMVSSYTGICRSILSVNNSEEEEEVIDEGTV